jgi:hypothetical protein
LTATGASVSKQLNALPSSAFAKLAKASDDSDDGRADNMVAGLDLSTIGGMADLGPLLLDTSSDRADDVLTSIGIPEGSDFFNHANDRAAAYARNAPPSW